MKKVVFFSIIISAASILQSCLPSASSPGFEYLSDMSHSLAVETYTTSPRNGNVAGAFNPVAGTMTTTSEIYKYANTESDKQKAIAELNNPYKASEISLDNGKRLYENQCAICHGKDGAGQGDLILSGKYPPVPPTYFGDRVLALKEGGIYHAIMYGFNAMGSYAAQLEPKERWEVIAYIREMQAKKLGADKVPGYVALSNATAAVKTDSIQK